MIVTLVGPDANDQSDSLLARARSRGESGRRVVFGDGSVAIGLDKPLLSEDLASVPDARIVENHRPYMMASSEHRARTQVVVGDVVIGGDTPVLIAGPCVVEDRQQLIDAAMAVKAAGASILRGGAFKPRTSPYSFQGLGELGLQLLADAREAVGLPVVTEVLEPEQVETVAEYADMLQIGARNMANTPLLRRAGRTGKPILLKRGFSATIEEWLMSAEYIMAEGNPNVVLCERGIRGFDPAVRFNLDLNAVALVRELSHLPVVVDPSHGTGVRSLVAPMALAGIAAGANGLIIEALPNPESAVCDAYQTITVGELATIHRRTNSIAELLLKDVSIRLVDEVEAGLVA
ncbi:3-deoxy-7-phosphoheptulonate synthase [soil metagenome]